MTQVRVFNVGHGEAISIRLENNVVVVRDFGRSEYAIPTDASVSIERILYCCQDQYLFPPFFPRHIDAVLSHAHEDHFNGFHKLHNDGYRGIFRNAYIPWLDFNTVDELGGQILRLSLYLFAYYGLDHINGRRANHWILMAPIMYELSRRLSGVCSGYQINNWTPNAHVLWPPPPNNPYLRRRTNLIAHIVKDFESSFENIVNKEDFDKRVFTPIFKNLALIYSSKPNEYVSSENNQLSYFSEISNSLLQIEEFRQSFRRVNFNMGRLIFSHNRSIDDHSLVFELKNIDQHHALFLSDLNSSCINQMIQLNNLSNINYNLIKSAHHGTRYHNSLHLNNIRSEKIIHCCGPAHPNWNGPVDQYTNICNEIICTDWNYNSLRWQQPCAYRTFEKCCKILTI